MNEEDYKKLTAAEKKAVDTILRRIPRTIGGIDSVGTNEPKAETDNPSVIEITTVINLTVGLTGKEQRAVQGEPDLFK